MTINAVEELEKRGYVFTLTVQGLIYKYSSPNPPSQDSVSFLERLKANKHKAIDFLRQRELIDTPICGDLQNLPKFLFHHSLRLTGIQSMDNATGVMTCYATPHVHVPPDGENACGCCGTEMSLIGDRRVCRLCHP